MATIKFYLKNPKKDNKLRAEECSIYGVFTKTKEERFQLRIDEKIQPKFWDFKNQSVRGTHPRHYELNLYLQQFKTDLLNLYSKHRELPFEKFKLIATASDVEKKTLFIALNQFLKAYSLEKDSKTLGKYNTLAVQLERFDKVSSIDFNSLDHNFYDKFKQHLYSIPNPNYRNYSLVPVGNSGNDYSISSDKSGMVIGLFDDTVFKYIINLKTFCGWAGKRGFKVNNSYKEWEIITRKHEPITLTMEELERLENFEFTLQNVKPKKHGEATRIIQALDIARDYLIFECRTGQRISDIKRFDLKDLDNDKWTFTPRKGNRLSSKNVSVHFKGFCGPAIRILEKYNWRMPSISEQKLNEGIKRACKAAGIDDETTVYRWAGNKKIKIQGPKHEFISSHTGRRSFITLALQAGVPIEYVMVLTGITEYNTIKHYRGKFQDNNIEDYLNSISSKAVMKKAQ